MADEELKALEQSMKDESNCLIRAFDFDDSVIINDYQAGKLDPGKAKG